MTQQARQLTREEMDRGDAYTGVDYRGYRIKPKRDFGKGFHLIDGMPCRTGFVAVKDHCNAMPGATWFQTVKEAKESIDILEAVGEKGFWTEYERRKAVKAAAPDMFRALQAISTAWPINTTAKICDVHGINDGKDRAIKLEFAVEVARAAIAKIIK